MATKKLTLNELRALVKKIIKEQENEDRNPNYAGSRDTYFDTSYEDNWVKGGGPDEEEIRNARFETQTYYLRNGKKGTITVLVDEEDEDLQYSNYTIVNTPEGRNDLKNFMMGVEGESAKAVYNVNINGVETKVLVYDGFREKPEMY